MRFIWKNLVHIEQLVYQLSILSYFSIILFYEVMFMVYHHSYRSKNVYLRPSHYRLRWRSLQIAFYQYDPECFKMHFSFSLILKVIPCIVHSHQKGMHQCVFQLLGFKCYWRCMVFFHCGLLPTWPDLSLKMPAMPTKFRVCYTFQSLVVLSTGAPMSSLEHCFFSF